jgi:hypothetical protein
MTIQLLAQETDEDFSFSCNPNQSIAEKTRRFCSGEALTNVC